MSKPQFAPEKLLENAVTSIRLGVEDFRSTQGPDGDSGRAQSAVRNIFAGLLLLFKFRITQGTVNAEEGAKLIFNPNQIEPTIMEGRVVWSPTDYKRTTIDVGEIESRFKALGIETDWEAVRKLQHERNNIEHLYPKSGVGALGQFVADVFPVLATFIAKELGQAPGELLGRPWKSMDFYQQRVHACRSAWKNSEPPGRSYQILSESVCERCESPLVRPRNARLKNAGWSDGTNPPAYDCEECGNTGNAVELIEESLIDSLGGDSYYEDGSTVTSECPVCKHRTRRGYSGECIWCA